MKKLVLMTFILLVSLSLFGCSRGVVEPQQNSGDKDKEEVQQVNQDNEQAVRNLVEGFGKKLQMVSLLAPDDVVKKSMQENYAEYVSKSLLEKWQGEPQNAPGRLVSSPWPDRIEISEINKVSETEYAVKGEIIEIASTEASKNAIAAKRPIALTVKRIDNKWLIDELVMSSYQQSDKIVYENNKYGFHFTLPASWKDYKIITDKWEGLESKEQKIVQQGTLLSIRHPQWTKEKQRQDIPILIFTIAQWNALQKDEFHIGAAPIRPSELGRNETYVFALPARYNYSFPTGYEEVEEIMKENPLKAVTAK